MKAKEEFDLDKRLMELWDGSKPHWGNEAVIKLLRDFSKYVTPEREMQHPATHPDYNMGQQKTWNQALDQIESNTRKVLGDEH